MSDWLNNLQQKSFDGTDNVTIAYATMLQQQSSPAMILVNGRIESYLKYQDIANHFYRQGYSVYMLDHRGQGLSQRLIDDGQKGHVVEFSDYIDDLAQFVTTVVQPKQHSQLVMLGHSMGGAIVTRYLQTCQHPIDKAILASPMLGILLPAPKLIIKLLTHAMMLKDKLFANPPSYVFGGKDYENTPFDDNDLTQSAQRYQQFREVYDQFEQIKLGGPTNRWLSQSILACELCVEQADKIDIPTLLMQAGGDTVVDNRAQNRLVAQANQKLVSLVRFEGSRHELLFELDQHRVPTLAAIDSFIGEGHV